MLLKRRKTASDPEERKKLIALSKGNSRMCKKARNYLKAIASTGIHSKYSDRFYQAMKANGML